MPKRRIRHRWSTSSFKRQNREPTIIGLQKNEADHN